MLRKLLLLSLVAGFLMGCNTVHGMGEDISAGGHDISKAADGHGGH